MNWGEEPEFFGPRHYFRESLIVNQLKKRVEKGAMILDAGSGNGSLALRLGEAGFRVTGIDASDAFVAYAENGAKQLKLNGAVSFQKGDLLNTELPDETIDAVVSGEVLEHLEQDEKAVREFSRVLRKGGFCIVTVPAHPHLWDKNDEWAGHNRRYTKEGLTNIFSDKGFKIVQCHYWGFPLVRLFHRFVYLPMVNKKIMSEGKNITQEKTLFPRVLKSKKLHLFGAWVFSFDHLFNSVPLGIGLLMVARKKL